MVSRLRREVDGQSVVFEDVVDAFQTVSGDRSNADGWRLNWSVVAGIADANRLRMLSVQLVAPVLQHKHTFITITASFTIAGIVRDVRLSHGAKSARKVAQSRPISNPHL